MGYVTFKDREIYKRMKYTSIHRLMYKTETHVAVELELLDIDSNWHSMMPFEEDLKLIDEKIINKTATKDDIEFIKFYSKYRKWQKRKLYTIKEFNELFEPLTK
jgi:transcriptional regulator NrdR family protein